MTISKIFQKSTLCLAVFAIVVFGFAACGGLSRLTDNPAQTDAVYGNGGIAVQKGDYLYFTNGYIDTSAVGDTNEYGNIDVSAIYRVKLTNGKVVEKNVELDKDGNKVVDKKQELNDIEIVVPKVAGFEYSNLFIFGDYIYYTTPNHLKDGNLDVMSSYLNFYRAKLDRSGGIDLLYTTENENTNVSVTMYQIGNNVYHLVKDGSKVVLTTINGNSRNQTVLSENATSVAMPKYANSTDVVASIDNKIYFTESLSTEDNSGLNGTALKTYDLATKQTSTVFSREGETYTIKGTSSEYLYYTKEISANPGQLPLIYALDNTLTVETEISSVPVTTSEDATSKISSYALVSSEYAKSIVYYDGTNSYFKTANKNAIKIASSDVVSNLVSIEGDKLYYMADSTLKCLVYTSSDNTSTTMIPASDTPKADAVANFDVSGDMVFYFVKYNENYYMHYANYGATDDEGNKPYSHFIGKLQPADYLDEETEEESA